MRELPCFTSHQSVEYVRGKVTAGGFRMKSMIIGWYLDIGDSVQG
jgi:hypothetical protein